MIDVITTLWSEPRPADPPAPTAKDRLFGLVAAVILLADALLRPGQECRPLAVALSAGIAGLLFLRNRYPLAAFLIAFGVAFAVEITTAILEIAWQAPPSHALALFLPYALCRWGAGWEMGLGVSVLLASYVLAALLGDLQSPQDAVAGAVMLLFPAALGSTVRFRARSQAQTLDRVKLRERERLARELHDTVAHHVSAIAIQAQAGRTLADRNPAQALATLEVIEGAAKRTLDEMRDIVGALRAESDLELAPQRGLADLPELAAQSGAELDLGDLGDLDDLRPAAGSAIYRMVQEAITNAERHAKNKTGVWIYLRSDRDTVTLRVRNDGDTVAAANSQGRRGFGLLGLAERAALLGGRFEAGPDPSGGWRVDAVLPHTNQGAA